MGFPLRLRVDVVRFTSLFGGCCAGLSPPWTIGVVENDSGDESKPMLDLGLPFWEGCIIDSLLYQEPLDPIESLRSSPGVSNADAESLCFTAEALRLKRFPFPSFEEFLLTWC